MSEKEKLVASIIHWLDDIVEPLENEKIPLQGMGGAHHCACCDYGRFLTGCPECPVGKITKEYACFETPQPEYAFGYMKNRSKQFLLRKAWQEVMFLQNVYYAIGYTGAPWE